MSETSHELPLIRRALGSRKDTRVFRNQVGLAFVGNPPRPVTTGLVPGSADLIGWHSYCIKPEDVGSKVAVFLSVEVKTKRGVLSPKQRSWLEAVQNFGGIAFVATDPAAAINSIESWRPNANR